MGVAIGIGWGLGYWLDGKYGTGPWLMLVGLLFGVGAGFNGLIRTTKEVNANAARNALEAAASDTPNNSSNNSSEAN
jgi:F0F1-type ATP synthase assembly protein I